MLFQLHYGFEFVLGPGGLSVSAYQPLLVLLYKETAERPQGGEVSSLRLATLNAPDLV